MKMKLKLLAISVLFFFQLNAQNIGDFRSASSGDWTTTPALRWDVWDGDSWEDAVSFPNSSSGVITIMNGHTITVGVLSVNADQVVVEAGGILILNNTLTVDDGLGLDLDVNGNITLNSVLVSGTGTPSMQLDGIMDWSGGTLSLPTVISSGASLNILGGNKTLSTILSNDGTINWSASQVTFNNGTLNNNAVFNTTAASSFNHAGTTNLFNNNPGASFTKSVNAGNTTFNIPVNNAGTVNINSGSIISTGTNGSWINSGAFIFGGGLALTISGSVAPNEFNAGSSFSGAGTITIAEDLNINTALSLPSTLTLVLSSAANIVGGTGSLEVNGTWNWNTGTLALPSSISATGILNLAVSNTKVLSSTLTNGGIINWTGFNLGFNNGTLVNNNIFNAASANAFTNSGGTNSLINNSTGTISKTTNAGVTTLNIPVTNSGLVDISTGTTTITSATAGFSNSGTINFSAGTVLNVSGTLAGGNSFNAGTIITGDGLLNLTTSATINTALVLPSAVSFSYSGNATTLGGTGSLSINGMMNWGAGTLAVPTTINASATLNLVTAAKTLSTTLNNNGTIDWSSSSINFSNGTLNNNNSFLISGAATNFTITSLTTNIFNNTGTITKTSAGSTGTGSVPFNSSGTINVNAGTFSKTGSNVISFTNSGNINIAAGAIFSHTIGLAAGALILDPGTVINGNGSIVILGNTIINTALSIPSTLVTDLGSNVNIPSVTGSGSITINGILNWAQGVLSVPMTIETGATMNSIASKTINASLINNGSVVLTDPTTGSITLNNATFTNNGTITDNFTVARQFPSGGGANAFINNGVYHKTNNVAISFNVNVPVTNNNAGIFGGTGIFSFLGGISNQGIIAPGGTTGIGVLTMGSNAVNPPNTPTIQVHIQNGTGAGTGHDQLAMSGVTTISGANLVVTETVGAPFQSYIIMTAPAVNGFIGNFAGTNLPAGYILVIDNSSNPSTVSVVKTPSGGGAPVFTFVPADVTVQCSSIPEVGSPTATDNCDGNVLITYNGQTITPGSCADSYTITRTWTASDNCGNSTNASQVITVIGDTDPVFTFVPADVSVQCNSIPEVGDPTASDNCDTDVSIVYNGEVITPGSSADSYVITRTWTATDNCGNSSTASQVITVTDEVAPAFNFVPANTTVSCSAIPGVGNPTATDNCDTDVEIIYDGQVITAGNCSDSYTITRTWRAIDNAGNFVSASQLITVVDNTAPVFSFVPANTTAQCNAIPGVENPTANDNCDTEVSIVYNGQTITPGTCADSYTITRTWTATDNCGNSTIASQEITVVDDTDPVFSFIPANTTVQCNASLPALGSPAATDNCDQDVTIVYNGETITAGSCADSYTVTRTWTATDNCGNSTMGTQVITVIDDTDPVFNFVPANTTAQCNSIPAAGVPTAIDNCDNDVSIIYNGEVITPGSSSDSYTITRSWTATDNCGNTATASQVITVIDNTAPVFTFVPANTSAECSSIPAVGNPAAMDNCDASVTITYIGETITPGTCADSYTITRTWSATDDAGNSAEASQVIMVSDATAPVFSFVPASVSVQCGNIPPLVNPVATDNCDDDVAIIYHGEEFTPGACEGSFTLTRTWTAMDNCGNATNAHQIITVTDNTLPVFSFVPANTTIQCNETVPAPGIPSATDNCDTDVEISYNGETVTQGNCPGSYTITRSWTATDDCGNNINATQMITVVDNAGPVIQCPANATRTTGTSCNYTVTGNEFNATATDNCSGAVLSYTLSGATSGTGSSLAGVIFNTGITTVSWTAIDGCHNSSSCSFTVTVIDAVPPQILCPGNIEQAANCSAQTIAVPNPQISDNCNVTGLTWTMTGATTASSPAAGINFVGSRTFNPGITTVTYIVRDGAGNNSTCSFTVTITGNSSLPAITCPPDITINAFPLLCYGILFDLGRPETSGGCGGGDVVIYNDHPSFYYPVGVTEVQWTAEDEDGNKVHCIQKVTVIDNQQPLVLCGTDRKINANPGQCYATNVNLGSPLLAWDNCGIANITNNAPAQFPLGNTVVTWTITDVNGNSSTCQQDVTVEDRTGPVLTCPANISQTVTGSCSKSIAIANPVVTDNCSGVTKLTWKMSGATTANSPSGGINYVGTRTFNAGVTTITYTAWDGAGNSSSCSFTVSLTGSGAPNIVCPSNISQTSGSNCSKDIKVPDPKVTATCGSVASLTWVMTGATTASSPNSGINYIGKRTFNVGTTVVTYTARDASGNARTCSFTVNIYENQKPKVKCPSNITQSAGGNNCSRSIAVPNPNITDNCGLAAVKWVMTGATTGSSPSTGINYVGTRNFNVGTTQITYTAIDNSGNQQTCSFTVRVTGNCNRRSIDIYTRSIPEEVDNNEQGVLNAKLFPNPSETGFNLVVNSTNDKEVVKIKVYDVVGRMVYQAQATPGQSLRIGDKLTAGTYMVEIIQGKERTTIRMIKQ